MPRKAKDITGETFKRLTALCDTGKRTYGHVWLFQCSCGNQHEAVKSEVTGGSIGSCGCAPNSGRMQPTHGGTNEPTYITWRSMLDRCYREGASNYRLYGGSGIEVCPQWRTDYAQFRSDMGLRPKGKTIDRIDGTGNYEPSNCRWATPVEQANNTKTTRVIEFRGERRTLSGWSEVTGLALSSIKGRIGNGWTVEETLTIPRYKQRKTGDAHANSKINRT